MYDDGDSCRSCGVRDYGFDLPDVRSTLHIQNCTCKNGCKCDEETRADLGLDEDECACDNGQDCNCDRVKIQVRINRIWDRECEACGGVDWRPEWQVLKDDVVIATVPSEVAASAVIGTEFPDAEPEPRDEAWESERFLRMAEGWGY